MNVVRGKFSVMTASSCSTACSSGVALRYASTSLVRCAAGALWETDFIGAVS
jgi:hypothetical protein